MPSYSNDPLRNLRRRGGGRNDTGIVSPYDAAAVAYFAAMTTQEPENVKRAINDFIVGCKADGTWSLLDRLVAPMGTEQATLLDMVKPTKTAINVNACTFVAYSGLTGNGTTSYVDFGEVFNAAGNQYALNSATIGGYARDPFTRLIGDVVGNTSRINPASTVCNYNVNTSTAAPAVAFSAAMHSASRTSSSVTKLFKGGSILDTSVAASNAIPTANVSALRANGTLYTATRHVLIYWGAGMTDAQVLALHARCTTLLTSLGAL